VSVLSRAGNGGEVTGHVAAAFELATHRAAWVGLCAIRRVLCTPHMNFCLCVNWTWMSDVWFLWKVKSAPSAVARARRAPCLVVCERGVCVWLALYVCALALMLVYL
jgi:hypothetical protein